MIYLIGGNGFVGSALTRLFSRRKIAHAVITRSNFSEFEGSSCDILINANGNSKKFLAAREPLQDFDQSVRSVAISLSSFKFGHYTMLSSGDVYPEQYCPEVTRESAQIEANKQSRYGLHKFLAEQLVQNCGCPWLVFRMGGMVGPGLKKNAIYDMLKSSPVWLSPDSELQFLSTDQAAKIIWDVISSGVREEIFNLGGEGVVNLGELHRTIASQSEFKADAPCIRYELSLDKLKNAVGTPIPRAVDEVEIFIRSVKEGEIILA